LGEQPYDDRSIVDFLDHSCRTKPNWQPLQKILLLGIIFAVIFDCCEVVVMVRIAVNPTWHNWWMVFFLPTAACLLNAWLFLRFKATAGLGW